ncbi:MAG: UPF0175 family protein [Verrucomicrobiota bacterium]
MKGDFAAAILPEIGASIEPKKLEAAVELYRERKLSMGRAAQMAGLLRPVFQRELAKRGVTVDYDVEDFEDDLRAIEKLLPR